MELWSNSSTNRAYDANSCMQSCCSVSEIEETLPRQCIACVRFCWQGNPFNGSSSCTEFCRLGVTLDSEDQGFEPSATEEGQGMRTAVLVLALLSGCLLLVLLGLLARSVRRALRQRRGKKPLCRPPIFNPRRPRSLRQQEEEGELVPPQDAPSGRLAGLAGSEEVRIPEGRKSVGPGVPKVAAAVLANGFGPRRPAAAAKEGALLCGRTEWSATLSTTPPQGRLDVDAGSVCEALTDDEFHDAWSPGNTPANARRSFDHAHVLSDRHWV